MTRRNRFLAVFLYLFAVLFISIINIQAQLITDTPDELKEVDVIEHLGDTIPLDIHFTDDYEQDVIIGDYFNKDKPVILIMGYYTCPMLCNLVFNGVRDAINDIGLEPGKDFLIVTVSIDSSETPLVASAKKKNYLESLEREISDDSWMFLTGEAANSKKLADVIGFQYYYDFKTEQYAHAALLTILSPDGKISRYLYGIQFDARNLKMALIEASEGKVGTTLDRLLLYCYHYDPQAGGYTLLAGNIMKLGGAVTLGLLVIFVGFMIFKEKRKNREQSV